MLSSHNEDMSVRPSPRLAAARRGRDRVREPGAGRGRRAGRPGSGRPMLSVSDLAVSFGPVRALDGVSLTVNEGEIVALAGENGAGKTTLVRCIGGDIEPDAGVVRLGGKVMPPDPGAQARRGIGVVWQDLALCDNLDIAANLMLGREHRRQLRSDVRMHTDAMRLLARLGIPLRDTSRSVRSLSGGQRQLVAVARAVARRRGCCCSTSPPRRWACRSSREVEHMIIADARAGHRGPAGLPRHRPDVPAGRPHRGAAARPGGGRGRPAEVHPDDVLALLSGQQVGLLGPPPAHPAARPGRRLVSADPSSSLSLILSALGAALGSERLCIHLLDGDSLACAASLGLPAGPAGRLGRLPAGPAGGPAGRAAAAQAAGDRGERRGPAVAGRRSATWPGRPRWRPRGRCRCSAPAAWSASSPCCAAPPGGRSATTSTWSPCTPATPPARSSGTGCWSEVTTRNRVLETIREMLETLAGPLPVADGLGVALQSLRRGLQAAEVALVTEAPVAGSRPREPPRCRAAAPARRGAPADPSPALLASAAAGAWASSAATTWPQPGRRTSAGRARRLLTVTFAAPGSGAALVATLAGRPAAGRRDGAAGGRRALAAAGPGARGGAGRPPGGAGPAPVPGAAAGLPVPAQPRAAHAADRHPGLRLQPAAARRDLGRRVPAPVHGADRGRVGPARAAGG